MIYLIAAEQSADRLGAPIAQALRETDPNLQLRGIAGPRLREIGMQTLFPMEKLQVMGFSDVAFAFPRILKLFLNIKQEILALNPKAVICIDYPGFNLRLQRSLRKSGYRGKLIHVVCPTVWAWGKGRIPMMIKNLDLLLTLFPFEEACFANTSLSTAYIGHPLARKVLSYEPDRNFHLSKPLLALFPGSRKIAVERNFPLQLEAAERLRREIPNLQIAVSLSHPELRDQIRALAPNATLIEPAHTYDLMNSADLALATSGTVTLELALFETPTVVNYAIRPFDLFLAQKIFRINLPHYCIVNILANKRIFPELYGPNLSVDALVHHAKELWEKRSACHEECRHVREILGTNDAAKTAAKRILDTVFA